MTGDDQKRTLWDGSLPFRGEIRRLGSLLPSRSREGPDYVPLSQHSPLKGRGLNGSSPPPKRPSFSRSVPPQPAHSAPPSRTSAIPISPAKPPAMPETHHLHNAA